MTSSAEERTDELDHKPDALFTFGQDLNYTDAQAERFPPGSADT